ncbi:MAG: c-type cytochrome [Asticcacaulis sp.]|uniref:c-type cytochrome n=1 Tax=Asticcacaulis sp. TaxID=1872648 RepID=UPI0039E4B174
MKRLLIWSAAGIVLAGVAASAWLWNENRFAVMAMRADPAQLPANTALFEHLTREGRGIFQKDCAVCHGANAKGDRVKGTADLTDDDYLYGEGELAQTEQTILYGIRSGDPKGWNLAYMPAFGTANPYGPYKLDPLTPGEIDNLAAYLSEASKTSTSSQTHGVPPSPAALSPAAQAGYALYDSKGCWDCHAADRGGDGAIGAPNLVDKVWLYGTGSKADIAHTLTEGRKGQMPAFFRKLTARQVRAVSAYVYSLQSHKKVSGS